MIIGTCISNFPLQLVSWQNFEIQTFGKSLISGDESEIEEDITQNP